MGRDFPVAEGVPICLPEMLSTRTRSASWDRCRSAALARAKLFPSLGRNTPATGSGSPAVFFHKIAKQIFQRVDVIRQARRVALAQDRRVEACRDNNDHCGGPIDQVGTTAGCPNQEGGMRHAGGQPGIATHRSRCK